MATAAGLAMGGFRPVVAIYSTFLNRAWDQLYYDVGLHGLPVIFCIDRAGITGDDGPSHNGVMDLALLTKVPGMTVLAPSCYEEIPVMLAQAIAITSGPVALRWPKTEARHCAVTGTGLSARQVRAGRTRVLPGAGQNGGGVRAARRRSSPVAASRPRCGTCGPPHPLDPLMLCDALRHQVVITVEDGVVAGGVGARSPPPCGRRPNAGPLPTIVSCGLPLAYFPQGKADDILAGLGLDGPAWPSGRSRCAHRAGISDCASATGGPAQLRAGSAV